MNISHTTEKLSAHISRINPLAGLRVDIGDAFESARNLDSR